MDFDVPTEPTGGGAPQSDALQSFEEMLDASVTSLHTGAIVKGTVVHVTTNEVIVDLGFKSDGIISREEFIDDPSADLTELAKPGDVFEVRVLRVNDKDGNVIVSKKKVDAHLNFQKLEQAFEEKTILPGKIVDVVKGGLLASILGCRVFVPASQMSTRFEKDLAVFKGKEFDFNILEFDRSKKRIVGGRKDLIIQEAEKRRNEIFNTMEVGQIVEGTVSRLADFGAFVDLGGVDGLIHVSEASWKRIRKISEVLSEGDQVSAYIVALDPEQGKISLSLKDAKSNPWNGIADRYPIGEIVQGTVVRLAVFGAFVNLEEGIDGLVHISQIAEKHVAKPEDELSPGQVINVKVVGIDIEQQRISLSKREADAFFNPPEQPEEYDEEEYDDTLEAEPVDMAEDVTNEDIAPEVAEEATNEI